MRPTRPNDEEFLARIAAVQERVAPHLPRAQLQEIAGYHAGRRFGRHKPHYVDFDRALKKAYEDVVVASLDHTSGFRILDIGTGPGCFPFVLERLGHQVVATEVPVDESVKWRFWRATKSSKRRLTRLLGDRVWEWASTQRSLYGDFCDAYGVERFRWSVEAQKPAPDALSGFDAIFARSLYFDKKGTNEVWTQADWRFFLDDMASRMTSDTSILFLSTSTDRHSLAEVLKAEIRPQEKSVWRMLTRAEIRQLEQRL